MALPRWHSLSATATSPQGLLQMTFTDAQGTPPALQLLPDPFKRSPLLDHSPDGGMGLSRNGARCTSAFSAAETPQPLVSLSPPQPPQMQWDPPQLPLQLDSTPPLPQAHWPVSYAALHMCTSGNRMASSNASWPCSMPCKKPETAQHRADRAPVHSNVPYILWLSSLTLLAGQL